MCMFGIDGTVEHLEKPITAWRVVMKTGLPGIFAPVHRTYCAYTLGKKIEASNPYARPHKLVKDYEDEVFKDGEFGFYALKTRKQAREYRAEHFCKLDYTLCRVVKVLLHDRVVKYEEGYRAQAMTIVSLSK